VLDGNGNSERRFKARLPHSSLIKVKELNSGVFANGMMINYSRGGLCLETDSLFKPGAEVFIAIEDSPFDDVTIGHDFYRAVIRHRSELDDSFYCYGYGAELIESFGSAFFQPKEGMEPAARRRGIHHDPSRLGRGQPVYFNSGGGPPRYGKQKIH
jgi:hypothetical protein